jgi:hypothetical protein
MFRGLDRIITEFPTCLITGLKNIFGAYPKEVQGLLRKLRRQKQHS